MKQKLLSILALLTIGMANIKAQTSMTGTVLTQPCNDDGVIGVTVTGLIAPINYTYNTGYPTYQTIIHSNVMSLTDTYTGVRAMQDPNGYSYNSIYVVASDGFGNQVSMGQFPITPAFQYTATSTPVVCPGNGQITVSNITGGTAPYSYQFIAEGTLQTYATNPATITTAGQYSITVTDGNGCKVHVDTFQVQYQSSVVVSFAGTNANCTNGTASVTASGGVAPYTYLWSNGATTQNISGLTQNYFNCVVTDAQGCISNYGNGYYVQQSVTLNYNNSVTNATCVQNNGSIISFVNGGTAPYSFLWDNGATTQNITGLAGNQYYQAQITDANGCTGTGYAYVSATTPINVTYTASPSSCTSATGSATVTATGGTAPYTIVWNTFPSTTTGISIANKPSGNYGFTVTDAVGCVRTGSAFIPPVSTINASIYGGSVVCPVTTGNLNLNVSGTNAPFTYAWSNGATTTNISNVALGSYNCVITDAVGCSVTRYGSVYQTSPLNVGFASTQASCIYAADGSILAFANGGTAPYSYSWSNGQTTANATGLTTGNYYLSVTDANGCHNDYNNYMANVGYNASNNSCYCTITGTVYADANNNCTQDGGEVGIQNIQIHASGLGYAYTNANGAYSFMAPTGSYTLTESVQQIYPLAACQSNNQVVSVTAASGCTTAVNFANNIVPIHDLHIITTSVNQPVPGNMYYQKVIVQNEGTLTENNVQLGYTNDGQLSYSNCTPWALAQQNAGTYPNWYSITSGFPSLNAGTASSSYIDYSVATNVPMNTLVNFYDSVAHAAPINTVWLTDNTPWNNVNNHQSTVVSSFDPNFKEVTPKGTGAQGYILQTDSVLTYVVHFQNEGTYFAQNIVVIDSLDSDLNVATLRPGYSDHNYTLSVNENRVAKFKFANINLAWKSQYGDLMSSGMFTYSIKLKKNLAVGTQIKNKAAIYFDYNEPVITNTTLNTIAQPVSVKEMKGMGSDNVVLFPNPTNGAFSVMINATEKMETALSITDINGRIVSNKSVTLQVGENTLQENTNQLQSGIYFVQLKTNETIVTKKLVVTK